MGSSDSTKPVKVEDSDVREQLRIPSNSSSSDLAQLEATFEDHHPEANKGDTEKRRLSSLKASLEQYAGPLPPPHILKQYNEVVPNGAERIFKRFEAQSSHRIEIETFVIKRQQNNTTRGQYLAFFIVVLFLAFAVFAVSTGHDAVAGIAVGTTVTGLVGVFITGRISQQANLRSKR